MTGIRVEKVGWWKVCICVGAVMCVALISSMITLAVIRSSLPRTGCHSLADIETNNMFGEDELWYKSQRISIPGKSIAIQKTPKRCYIMKHDDDDTGMKTGTPMEMEVVHGEISGGVLDALGGPAAVEFCDGLSTFMTKDIINGEISLSENLGHRFRRQTPSIPYDESKNANRCMDVVIICPDHVGETSSCWTGINGLFFMERTCKSETEVTVQMTKPPGRILKILQEQWFICQARKREGKRC